MVRSRPHFINFLVVYSPYGQFRKFLVQPLKSIYSYSFAKTEYYTSISTAWGTHPVLAIPMAEPFAEI